MKSSEINQMITDRMVKALENGVTPWHRPWSAESGGIPRSMSTGKAYRGINVWVLALTAEEESYTSPWWGSFHKIKSLGGHLRKGSHGTKVFWWKPVIKPDPNDPEKTRQFFIGGCETVFNASQVDNLPDMYYPNNDGEDVAELPQPQALIDDYLTRGPTLTHAPQGKAYYQPFTDEVTLPERCQFESSESYYATAFHELAGHSTGHKSRCNREGITDFTHFGDALYGREELVAELSSAFCMASCGIESTLDNSAAYLGSWIKAIKGDVTLVPKAARMAQSAVDYFLGTDDQDSAEQASQELVSA